MRNSSEIKAYYASLDDDLLQVVYASEFGLLTPEARDIISAEIRKRNLPLTREVVDAGPAHEINSEYLDWLTEHLLQAEQKTASPVQEPDPDKPVMLKEGLVQLKTKLVEKLQRNDGIILWASVWFMGGLAFGLLPQPRNFSPLYPVLAYGSILVGCIRFLHGLLLRSRHRKLIRLIEKSIKEFDGPAVFYPNKLQHSGPESGE